jgi:hypothetical protein
VAVRIKATGQINGVVNNLNADVTRIAPDWDHATDTWITRPTRNPASLYRYVLQSPANARPKPDAEIDLAALQSWHEYCAAKGLCYDRVHDFEASLFGVLRDVAAAGRATPRDSGTRWTVAVDRPQTLVVGHVTPRNSWGFQGERAYLQPPDAFRVPSAISPTATCRPSAWCCGRRSPAPRTMSSWRKRSSCQASPSPLRFSAKRAGASLSSSTVRTFTPSIRTWKGSC